ncbi:hypothetical protein [Propionivibrio sp.]|uniref:hypothetical protein n=1 Tax=Propionivibrio sp. TaxID=2212460 RepID=UPI003BF4E7A8
MNLEKAVDHSEHGGHSENPQHFRISWPTQRVIHENIASHCFSAVFAVFAVVNCFFQVKQSFSS